MQDNFWDKWKTWSRLHRRIKSSNKYDQNYTWKPNINSWTITEIYDYLRLLYARIGIPHCPECGKEISQQTIGQIAQNIISEGEGLKVQILAPIIKDRKGQHKNVFEDLREKGFVRVRVDGEIHELEETFDLKKTFKHTIEVIVDRLIIRKDLDFNRRLSDSLETASQFGEGVINVLYENKQGDKYENVLKTLHVLTVG